MAIENPDENSPQLEYFPELGDLYKPEEELFNTLVYHGVRDVSTVEDILDSGSIKSRQRKQLPENHPEARIGEICYVEDILRFFEGKPEKEINLIEFAEKERDYIREHGRPQTNQFIDNSIDVLEFLDNTKLKDQGSYGPLRDFCVSVGDEITFHVASRVKDEGVAFEASVPKETVLDYGAEGNILGEIPLDYVTTLYYGEGLEDEEIEKLESHGAVEEHGLVLEPLTNYREESQLF